MAEPSSDEWLYRTLRRVAGTAAHLLSLGFPVVIALVSKPGSSLFSWHPFLMAVAASLMCTCVTSIPVFALSVRAQCPRWSRSASFCACVTSSPVFMPFCSCADVSCPQQLSVRVWKQALRPNKSTPTR
ncbi:transmembrane reductase CYB561D2 isoform X4 [Chiloscyllium punctatum]|uniref:transmembrane reductase CYB561D2 isoform X4 n=1 Tax=Chiloscyllium punctatum TaxID=137246 RepID=UPI003B640976